MIKRALSGLLWFVAMLCTYELAIYFVGGPRLPGPVIALSVALFVAIDPRHAFWPASPPRAHRISGRSAVIGIRTD